MKGRKACLKVLLPGMVAVAVPILSFAHTEITPAEAYDRLAQGGDVILLDVREYDEFCGSNEHIRDALNLPWTGGIGPLATRFSELPVSVDIIVVCAAGGRSHAASNFLDGEGFPYVYDMEGGMGAWSWSREACDPEPLLLVYKSGPETLLNWTPMEGEQDYDLMRGRVENMSETPTHIDLGPVDCILDDLAYTYGTDTLPSGAADAFFYLARQVGGSLGQSSGGLERRPTDPDCQ